MCGFFGQGANDDRDARISRACVLFIAKSIYEHQSESRGQDLRDTRVPLTKILNGTGAR